MKLGIGLPNTLVPSLNRGLLLDWARIADRAGFHAFGTIDKPNYDSWDPMVTLAAVAAVTERVRLGTTVLQLPNRNETLVAKQAAVIDRLSGGRLDLGVGIGAREDDYKVFNARFAGRGKKVERQIRKIRRVWRAAKKADVEQGVLGPAPMQKPLPPIWIGGKAPRAQQRAVELADGFIFSTSAFATVGEDTARLRAMADEAGKKKFQIAAIAYVAVADDAAAGLEQGSQALHRYFGGKVDVASLIHHGPIDVIEQAVKTYEQAGVDLLILFPTIADTKQVEQIGERILPAYRVPAR